MARRKNSLFIGTDFLNTEGRQIKHTGLIKEYGTVNLKKVSDNPLSLIGLDIETNYKTAELKLLGLWNGEKYFHYTENFIESLYQIIKLCDWKSLNLAYWNKLDPFIIFKEFISYLTPEQQERALKRYGKVGGEWSRKDKSWSVSPLVELRVNGTQIRFGIKKVIRSSIQFFIRTAGEEFCNTVWAFDIASLYKSGLEREALGKLDEKTGTYPNARLPYYTKMGEEFHKVDWERFKHDSQFKKSVLKSNELDARAVYDLGNIIQEQFKEAFGYYPTSLISTGTLARASIVATLKNKYYKMYGETKEAENFIKEDIKAIGLVNYYDKWSQELPAEKIKDLLCLSNETYSGGYIEAIKYGTEKEAYYSDIASAYPGIIVKLWDLRDAKITYGEGEPPRIKNSYCLIRGDVWIPEHINFHPMTAKHLTNLDTNVRYTGDVRQSYTIGERDDLLELGAKFSNETWYNIETTGKLSPIAEAVRHFVDLRKDLIAQGNSAEYMAKISANSAYGILYEATETYEETDQLDVIRVGYRGGEFLNSIFATYITSEVRRLISKASNTIAKRGGEPLLLMTDAVFWKGTPDMIPSELVRHEKTLGFFETPVKVTDIICLGTGRYTYKIGKDEYITKNRGLNISDIHSDNGVDVTDYNWHEALKVAEKNQTLSIKVKVRTLVSVGMVLHNGDYNVKDLGLVDEATRDVDLITGLNKRILTKEITKPSQLINGSVMTKSLYVTRGIFGNNEILDQTLPVLREEVMKKTFKTAKIKNLESRSKASYKYNKANKETILKTEREKYNHLRELGYTRIEAKLWCKRGWDRINNELLLGGN